MVLLHHEVEVEYADGRPAEKHQATLLEFGKVENGRSTTAMALTVGIPAAIGALVRSLTAAFTFHMHESIRHVFTGMIVIMMQLLLQNKVQRKGVIRPLEPEVYIPG